MRQLLFFILLFCAISFAVVETYDITVYPGEDINLVAGDPSDHQRVLILGGGAGSVALFDYSYTKIAGTDPLTENTGIHNLSMSGYSTLDFEGGEIKEIVATHDSVLNLSGGSIEFLESRQTVSYITITCLPGYSYATVSGETYAGILTGQWASGVGFSIKLINAGGVYNTTYENIAFNVVPEPMTLALLGLGALYIRKRKTI